MLSQIEFSTLPRSIDPIQALLIYLRVLTMIALPIINLTYGWEATVKAITAGVGVLVADAIGLVVIEGGGGIVLVAEDGLVSIGLTGVADATSVTVGGRSANCGVVKWLSLPILQLTVNSDNSIKKNGE